MRNVAAGPEPVKIDHARTIPRDWKAALFLERWPRGERASITRRVAVCESPIEVAFALAMMSAVDDRGAPLFTWAQGGATPGTDLGASPRVRLVAQHPTTLEGRSMRIDFALLPRAASERPIAIELDGHEFHASPEARESDTARDRALMRAGWSPIRFTGRAVWADADACAAEALAFAGLRAMPTPGRATAEEAEFLKTCDEVWGDSIAIPPDRVGSAIETARIALRHAAAIVGNAERRAETQNYLTMATTALDGIAPRELGRVLRSVVAGLRDDVAELRAVLAGER